MKNLASLAVFNVI